MTEPLTVDKSRYPYILRDTNKKPVVALYDLRALEDVQNVFVARDRIASLTETIDHLHEVIELARQKLGELFTNTSDDEMISSPVREAYQMLEDAYVSPAKREPVPETTVEPTKPKTTIVPGTDVEISVGQVWATKKKGDKYAIVNLSGDEVTLSWVDGKYKRIVVREALLKGYVRVETPSSERISSEDVIDPGPHGEKGWVEGVKEIINGQA